MTVTPNVTKAGKSKSETTWAIKVAALALSLTLIPYLIGLSFAGDRHFLWLGYNLDDSCVYLSWMKQAAAGATHAYNMFTVEKQNGMSLNPLFLVLGNVARLLHLPLILVYHASRIGFGATLLASIWALICRTTEDRRARKLAFLIAAFGSGLGWIPGLWPGPIDSWQPEAITFLSLYLSPLFCFSLTLQVLSVVLLLDGILKKQFRNAILSGICVFVLGLTHTYDVITMLAIFGAMIVLLITSRILVNKVQALGFCSVAGAISLPAVAYIYHQLQTETVFRERAMVPTLSGPFYNLLLGFGIPLLLALFTIISFVLGSRSSGNSRIENEQASTQNRVYTLALAGWMIANIAVSYLPESRFPFQRKMLQGAHIPIAILAGIGLASIMSRIRAVRKPVAYKVASAVVILVLFKTNIRFMLRDMESYEIDQIQTTHMHRPYIVTGELDALNWVEQNSSSSDAIQPLPWLASDGTHFGPVDMTLACIAPGMINRKVYCGHWGETPDYNAKLATLEKLGMSPERVPDAARLALLREMKVSYLIYTQKNPEDEGADRLSPIFRGKLPLPPYLTLVYSNKDADVYRVNPE